MKTQQANLAKCQTIRLKESPAICVQVCRSGYSLEMCNTGAHTGFSTHIKTYYTFIILT